jgi:predicted AAA+ superfamily ATPase
LLSAANADAGHQIENIVYLELLRRGYRVNIGKIGEKEIDFVAARQNTKEYYQVAMIAFDDRARERELEPLKKAGDNYPLLRLVEQAHFLFCSSIIP